MEQQLFREAELNDSYKLNGFVKIPFVKQQELAELREVFLKYCPQTSHEGGDVFYSMFANTVLQNLQIKDRIKKILQPAYENTFVGFRTFYEMFLVKKPGKEPLLLHQDWSYAEEQEVLTATVWLPLQRTVKENGTLFFVPHSHGLFKNYRSGSLPSGRFPLSARLQKYCMNVEVDEGEAIIFHQGIFHGSYPNLSGEDRVVVAGIVIPDTEVPNYFHYSKKTQDLFVYELDESRFFEQLPELSKGEIFEGNAKARRQMYSQQQITELKLAEAIESEMKYAV